MVANAKEVLPLINPARVHPMGPNSYDMVFTKGGPH